MDLDEDLFRAHEEIKRLRAALVMCLSSMRLTTDMTDEEFEATRLVRHVRATLGQ